MLCSYIDDLELNLSTFLTIISFVLVAFSLKKFSPIKKSNISLISRNHPVQR